MITHTKSRFVCLCCVFITGQGVSTYKQTARTKNVKYFTSASCLFCFLLFIFLEYTLSLYRVPWFR